MGIATKRQEPHSEYYFGKAFHGYLFRNILKMQQILVIFALIWISSARASSYQNLLQEIKHAHQANAYLRAEMHELKRARLADEEADAGLRAEVQEIKRLRREDADIIADLKKLIRSEIDSHKGNKSACEMGTKRTTKGASIKQDSSGTGFVDNIKIPFGRAFKRIPKVSVAISEFRHDGRKNEDGYWGLKVAATSLKTDSFNLYLNGVDSKIDSLTASWIACE